MSASKKLQVPCAATFQDKFHTPPLTPPQSVSLVFSLINNLFMDVVNVGDNEKNAGEMIAKFNFATKSTTTPATTIDCSMLDKYKQSTPSM